MATAQTDKWISDLVGVFADPIIVYPGGWGDVIPERLKNQITLERLIENMKRSQGEEPTGTEAEACAYLMTASLTQPIDSDWTQIYLYVATKVMKRINKVGVPNDIAVESISDYRMNKLNDLKDWIYRQRVERRREKGKAERRQQKEEKKKQFEVMKQKFF